MKLTVNDWLRSLLHCPHNLVTDQVRNWVFPVQPDGFNNLYRLRLYAKNKLTLNPNWHTQAEGDTQAEGEWRQVGNWQCRRLTNDPNDAVCRLLIQALRGLL